MAKVAFFLQQRVGPNSFGMPPSPVTDMGQRDKESAERERETLSFGDAEKGKKEKECDGKRHGGFWKEGKGDPFFFISFFRLLSRSTVAFRTMHTTHVHQKKKEHRPPI